MKWEILLAGFGGQGIMFLGQLMAYTAMDENKNTTWIPSYGPEMRGGTANCSVVISDKPVSSPIVTRPNILVVMNLPSLLKFENSVQSGGYLFVNSSLVEQEVQREDINVIKVPTNELAEELGNSRTANIVMLGAILKKTNCLYMEYIIKILEKKIPASRKELLELNKNALLKGMESVR